MTTIRRLLNRCPVLHSALSITERASDPVLLPPPSLALSAAHGARRLDIEWIESERQAFAICFRKGEVLLD